MTQALIRPGLAAVVAVFSLYVVTGAWAASKEADVKLLALYYHADW